MKLRFILIPDSDFGEITDTASAKGGRGGTGRHWCLPSTMSILSAVNAVNLVNAVNAVQIAPPTGGGVNRRS